MPEFKIVYNAPFSGEVKKELRNLSSHLLDEKIQNKVKTPKIGLYRIIIDTEEVEGTLVIDKRILGNIFHPFKNFYCKGTLEQKSPTMKSKNELDNTFNTIKTNLDAAKVIKYR